MQSPGIDHENECFVAFLIRCVVGGRVQVQGSCWRGSRKQRKPNNVQTVASYLAVANRALTRANILSESIQKPLATATFHPRANERPTLTAAPLSRCTWQAVQFCVHWHLAAKSQDCRTVCQTVAKQVSAGWPINAKKKLHNYKLEALRAARINFLFAGNRFWIAKMHRWLNWGCENCTKAGSTKALLHHEIHFIDLTFID